MQKIIINANLEWRVYETPGGEVVGVCDLMGLTAQAGSRQELYGVIDEVLYYTFLDHLEEGTLEQFLSDRGLSQVGAPTSFNPEMGVKFEVPFHLTPAQAA